MRQFLVPLVLCLAAAGLQAQPLNCVASAGVVPLLRAESRTDMVGDALISCTGGDPARVSFVNIDIFLNTNITSQPVGPGLETEALLLIDDPQPGALNTANNVQYQGQVRGQAGVSPGFGGGTGAAGSGNVYVSERAPSAVNRLTWNGIPIVAPPPGQTRTLRITNVRADSTTFDVRDAQLPAGVSMFISVSPQSSLPLGNSQLRIGTVIPSLEVTSISADAIRLQFRERFASAFRKRIENTPGSPDTAAPQNVPGRIFNTESGFTPTFSALAPGEIGVADTGTRFLIQFTGLPTGALLVAPASVAMTPEPGSGLMVRRVDGWNADFSGGVLADPAGPPAAITVTNNIGRIVYEVVAEPPYSGVDGSGLVEEVTIPVGLQAPANTFVDLDKVQVLASYAPLNSSTMMDRIAPEPRFQNQGQPLPLLVQPLRDSLFFDYVMSDPTPLRAVIRPDPDQKVVSSSVSISYIDGANWVTVKPITTPNTDLLEVEVDPTGFPVGTYQATLRLQLADQSVKFLPLSLQVKPAPELLLSTNPLTFTHQLGTEEPAAQVVYLTARTKAVNFIATPRTDSGVNWLSVTPDSGGTPKNLRISINPAGLAPGQYTGSIVVSANNATNSPQTIPVTLNVAGDRPFLASDGVVNAASFQTGAIAPGEIITLFGFNIGPAAVQTPGLSQGAPTRFAGVRVLFDEIAAPILAVSQNQLNVVVPLGIAGREMVNVMVEFDGKSSMPVALRSVPAKPGLFTLNLMGSDQAAAINQDETLNRAGNPARVGSVVSFYLTGAGLTNPRGLDGALAPSAEPFPRVVAPVSVQIGGREATVQYAGAAPGLVQGLIQINAIVPGGIQTRPDTPVKITVGGVETQAGVTIGTAP